MRHGWMIAVWAALAGSGCGAFVPNPDEPTAKDLESASKQCGPDGLLDDAEDNNNQVAAVKGRSGYWYTFGDKAGSTVTPALGGTFTMSAGGANGSANAAHINGKIGPTGTVYAGMGFNFVDPKGKYNASAYKGISFWAKVSAGSTTKVRLKVPDAYTDPDGKNCTECFNDFGKDLTLTTAWAQYSLPFAELKQMPDWGAPKRAVIESKELYGLQWQVNTPGAAYDLWIDDVRFTGCL